MSETTIKILKVFLGLVMLIAGILMLVLPGPGIVFIFAGLYLIATVIPGGKERVEGWRKRFNQWREERRTRSRTSSRSTYSPPPQESASKSDSTN